MKYELIKELISYAEQFEKAGAEHSPHDFAQFTRWLCTKQDIAGEEVNWEGKEKGRSPESVITTLIVHLNRHARFYAKSAMTDSEFSTQDEFIFLITLEAFGAMTKMDLIKKNIMDKSGGIQIINRLIHQGWVEQTASPKDRRSKIVSLTDKGCLILENQMAAIRKASRIVTGDLTQAEKMELIRLLQKLSDFHHPIYLHNFDQAELLDQASRLLPKNPASE